ncbi:ABC transporter [Thiomicrospira sp. XS5]|uniref:ABC transporter ATP-binding protein n=1 Tax=Thiomicrospira sp. XS5 TaxID=1775636 RepID=UPI000749A3C1|nr:ATP-binding cassette domain-containing protein [Thiomicrospira sp. XS5]KUJ74287.1 ABC transporter [Thiomicrospira sp. XS5]
MFRVEELGISSLLAPVSFALAEQEILMVSGVSGSGKSLLLRALADLEAHSGQAWLNLEEQAAFPSPVWRRRVMWFPAETAWWEDAVLAHYPPAAIENDQAWLLSGLSALGLSKSILKQPVAALSSGEKQRLALLRGLAFRPKVLLLDEVTANLDPNTTLAVEALVQAYLAEVGGCAVWVSHDPAQSERLASRQLTLSKISAS